MKPASDDEHRREVLERLGSLPVLTRYRQLLIGCSEESAAARLLPFLIVFIMLPVGVGALVEDHLGFWTFLVVYLGFLIDLRLFLHAFRWAGIHGLAVARQRDDP